MDFAAALAEGQSSKGAFVSSLRTTESSILEDSWNFWDNPCQNWRVTCEGLNYVKYICRWAQSVNNRRPVTINGQGYRSWYRYMKKSEICLTDGVEKSTVFSLYDF